MNEKASCPKCGKIVDIQEYESMDNNGFHVWYGYKNHECNKLMYQTEVNVTFKVGVDAPNHKEAMRKSKNAIAKELAKTDIGNKIKSISSYIESIKTTT